MKTVDKQIKQLPDAPGVYFFKRGRKILYIGKATSLRDRVRTYFGADLVKTRGEWVAKMASEATRVDYLATDSVLEALILESAAIKKHEPPYNTREKDDRSYLYVVITDEDWPRVLVVREKSLRGEANFRRFTHLLMGSDADKNLPLRFAFGPFPNGSELREAMKIIRKIFPFRDSCSPLSGKPCFQFQLGLCPGVCVGAISRAEYRRTIRRLILFFRGRKSEVIKNLEREMGEAARRQEFERAGKIKRQIFALRHIQDVALIKSSARVTLDIHIKGYPRYRSSERLEAYDIAHLGGQNAVGVMVVAVNGELRPEHYRRFRLRGSGDRRDDLAGLREILSRRFNHPEWPLPEAILVDGGVTQRAAAKRVLTERGLRIPVIAVTKDEHHRAKASGLRLRLNDAAHRLAIGYHRRRRDRIK